MNSDLSHCPSLRSRLKHLIAGQFRLDLPDPEKITDDEALIGGRLGLDSLDALELAMCVEDKFGITICSRDDSCRAFASIASLADFIETKSRRSPGQISGMALA